jgi:O-methyltransferase
MNFLSHLFYGVNPQGFMQGIQQGIDNIKVQDGIFTGDNLITVNRNLGFFQDEKLMAAWRAHAKTNVEESIVWRTAVLAWAANSVLGRGIQGDFVECGCYSGTTARILCDYTDFADRTDRTYFLYDLFDHDATMPHHAMPAHSKALFDTVCAKFDHMSNVRVTQGRVPEVLADVSPQTVAFMHIDLNNAAAEVGALEVLFDRLLPGGILVLDDYGWLGYKEQKAAQDPWLAARGYQVLELPTGQGLVFK